MKIPAKSATQKPAKVASASSSQLTSETPVFDNFEAQIRKLFPAAMLDSNWQAPGCTSAFVMPPKVQVLPDKNPSRYSGMTSLFVRQAYELDTNGGLVTKSKPTSVCVVGGYSGYRGAVVFSSATTGLAEAFPAGVHTFAIPSECVVSDKDLKIISTQTVEIVKPNSPKSETCKLAYSRVSANKKIVNMTSESLKGDFPPFFNVLPKLTAPKEDGYDLVVTLNADLLAELADAIGTSSASDYCSKPGPYVSLLINTNQTNRGAEKLVIVASKRGAGVLCPAIPKSDEANCAGFETFLELVRARHMAARRVME